LISKAQERPTTCKSGAPTQDGGNSSDIKVNTLSTGKTENALMSQEEKMLKVKQSLYGTDITELTRDGRSFMLIQSSLRLRESMKNLDSTSTDHSILFPNSHSTELLRCTVTLMCGSRDGETMSSNNNGGSMRRPRLLETTMDHGRTMP
jgi:hypothetical protein